jgi:hypothetical protein
MATDQAYKRAGEAFSKRNPCSSSSTWNSRWTISQKQKKVQSIGPVAKLDLDPAKWTKMLESATSVYKNDPQIQTLRQPEFYCPLRIFCEHRRDHVTRQGSTHYLMLLSASEQAPDGMRLERSPQYTASRLEEMPTPEEFQKDALKLVDGMKKLREAPVVDEDYRGRSFFRTTPRRTCSSN